MYLSYCISKKQKYQEREGIWSQVFLLTQKARSPSSRFLPFLAKLVKQKHRSAFLLLTQAKQFACFPTKLKPRLRGINGE